MHIPYSDTACAQFKSDQQCEEAYAVQQVSPYG
jgi:hypothetical protein